MRSLQNVFLMSTYNLCIGICLGINDDELTNKTLQFGVFIIKSGL